MSERNLIKLVSTSALCIFALVGCMFQSKVVDDVDSEEYAALGAKVVTPPTTNRYDGLTTLWKPKGRVYNSESIFYVGDPSVGGLKVTEDDTVYGEFKSSGTWSNVWARASVTNEGTRCEIKGNYEDAECFIYDDEDAMFGVVTDPSKISEQEMTNVYANEKACDIFKTASFDATNAVKFSRIQTVLESSITDKSTAITAFNELLSGLKAQNQ